MRWYQLLHITAIPTQISRLKALTQELLVQRLEPFHREIGGHVGYKGMWKIEESLGSHSDFMGTLLLFQPLGSYTRSSVVLVSVTNLNPQWLHLTHSNRSTINGLQRAKGKTCGRTCFDIINIINCPLLEHPKMFCIKMCNDLSRQRSTLPMPSQ